MHNSQLDTAIEHLITQMLVPANDYIIVRVADQCLHDLLQQLTSY